MRKRFSVAAMVVIAMMLMAPAVLAATSVTVTGNNVGNDWNVNTAADGTVTFVDDFGAPSGFGSGALQLVTGETNPARAQLNSTQDQGMLLADIDEVGYYTYVSNTSTGLTIHAPAINIAILADGQQGSFATLVFEPIYNYGNAAIVRGQWQEWDASGEAKWWSTQAIPGVCKSSCYVAFYDIKAANPDAVILTYAMNLGTWNPDITSAVDGFTIGEKTFDFEPLPTNKDQCKRSGWEVVGFKNQGQCIKFVNTGK